MDVKPEHTRVISRSLRHLADEIESTAVGSSRTQMYHEIADAIRKEADSVDALTRAR